MMLSLQNYNLIKSLIKLNFNFFETNIKTKYLSLNNNNSLSLKHKKLYYILNILKIVKNIKQFIQVLTFIWCCCLDFAPIWFGVICLK